ncbi:DUF1677 family protein (DUF1677) [Arabidopsis thaliana]|uniref:DUF1677 family protein (DUF1677) n=1 Tax=Arabidopsis thaliana TaxID=3702 RepID=Q9SK23_ARATH|nr:DUF1677 family protein (DUF1677) [Arabidopsis thaliana]AAD22695.1 unknown protein [Arabidopsis thaliana]ABE97177.1 hypothetical protein At2g09970 [Arabidopsis thaliana]AEC06137.1 DUF1677 family protein (DUF1677) [Arabidopsis thaliana]|eukprot:NP_178825.1 DUF1677 family protein (DUF1677) [Arabidopsis thaliana]
MSDSVLSDPTMLISTPDVIIISTVPVTQISSDELDSVTCDCCGLTDECTESYTEMIRERYIGKWISGFCSEAVKYKVMRTKRFLTTEEEAMARHMNKCNKFKSSSPPSNLTRHLISAMRQILRKSLDSPRMLRSMPNSPSKDDQDNHHDCVSNVLSRSDSCFASLT